MAQYLREIWSGRRRGPVAAVTRTLLAAAAVPYRAAVQSRNWMYDRGLLSTHPLPLPAVSVGNLTAGGSGKTPVVAWLASALQQAGRRPAILLRGYKSRFGISDEQTMLAAAHPDVRVAADPNRLRAAAAVWNDDALVNLFILDDAMQHRRVRRDVEIVLVNATEPWGFGHLLPRGLLRESLSGLRRADALIITHAAEATPAELAEIETTIRKHNPAAPIFHADHVQTGLSPFDGSHPLPMSALQSRKYFVACGIASPESFAAALADHGGQCVGQKFFPDHHPFSGANASELRRAAAELGAETIIVTAKDWAKLIIPRQTQGDGVPFWRADLEIHFPADHAKQLLDMVLQRTAR